MEWFSGYLREVSVLSHLSNDFWLIAIGLGLLLINLSVTFIHTNDERIGRIWDYLGRVEGVRFSNRAGTILFFVVLTLALWLLGFGAIAARCPILDLTLGAELALACVGAMIGIRLSDSLHSHLWLGWQYRNHARNPGLRTVPLCLVEAALLAGVFAPGFGSSLTRTVAAAIGFIVGWVLFASLRPGIRALRSIASLRRERWIPG